MKQLYVLCSVIIASAVMAQQPPGNLTNTVEKGMRTECKTCPYSLCTNTVYYEELENLTLLCWTRGTVIDSDRYLARIFPLPHVSDILTVVHGFAPRIIVMLHSMI